jgi:2-polyprenyl-6-methoxyphenol hydroxylase-like FAD-dependent oxidoreductase
MIMKNLKNSYPVIIVGGGPVGLFLGCCLHRADVPFMIFEKRTERISHSRSLGIHPVSLELFDSLGFVEHFLDAGIKIRRGLAYSENGEIGAVSFEHCPKPYNYILSLPQHKTEEILEKHLLNLNPDALLRGAEVTKIRQQTESVSLELSHSGQVHNFTCRCLVGCDGKESVVRKQAGIPFKGSSYPDTYIMGDFNDNTNFGNDAAVFLCNDGLIESFPLTGNRRRWVVKTANYYESVQRRDIEALVASRIGHDLGEEENFMLSSFGVQKLMAKPMAGGRVALAGDAAHVVSPIGGQGMNLGWLDAQDLASTLTRTLKKNKTESLPKELEEYSNRTFRVTKKVIKRAELNMKLGRKVKIPQLRNALVWVMLKTPLQRLMAKLFTMRYLERGSN